MAEGALQRVACAVLDDYQDAARRFGDWHVLEGRIDLRVYRDHFKSESALVEAISDVPIVVAMRERTPFPAPLFARLPALRLLVTTGQANAAIDLDAAQAHGVTVCATGTCMTGTSELTWALILAHWRRIAQEAMGIRQGDRWQTGVGRDLTNRRLGVLGLGLIGRQVAAVGKAFGMRVQAWSANLTEQTCAQAGIDLAASLDALLATSDIVTIHLALGERTRGLIGAEQLHRMKPTALLVNTARSPIVDEAALIEALEQGWIGGAALDVFDQEPLPAEHPLRRLDNVLATPHVGYVTEDTYRRYWQDAVEDVAAWLDGAPVRVLSGAT
jgi:phosphoglycerate dehydrogenase-like enzyme